MNGPQNQTTGNDGFTEDDVPMMSVGQPQQTDPNQVTTKPRQMPAGASPMPQQGTGQAMMPNTQGADLSGMPGNDQQPAPGQFDPAAMGADVQGQRAEDNDTSTNREDSAGSIQTQNGATNDPSDGKGGMDFKASLQIEAMTKEAMRLNPGLSVEAAVDVAGDAFLTTLAAWEHVGDGPMYGGMESLMKRFMERSNTHDQQGRPLPTTAAPTMGDRLRGHEQFVQKGLENLQKNMTSPGSAPKIQDQIRTWWNSKGRPPGTPRPSGQGEPSAPSSASPYSGGGGSATPGASSNQTAQPRHPETSPEDRQADDPPEPYEETVGEFARRMMNRHPDDEKLRQDMWQHRHSNEPMGNHVRNEGER